MLTYISNTKVFYAWVYQELVAYFHHRKDVKNTHDHKTEVS